MALCPSQPLTVRLRLRRTAQGVDLSGHARVLSGTYLLKSLGSTTPSMDTGSSRLAVQDLDIGRGPAK